MHQCCINLVRDSSASPLPHPSALCVSVFLPSSDPPGGCWELGKVSAISGNSHSLKEAPGACKN